MNHREIALGYINAAETEAEMHQVLIHLRLVRLATTMAHYRAMAPLGPMLGIEDVVEAAWQRVSATLDELRSEAVEAFGNG